MPDIFLDCFGYSLGNVRQNLAMADSHNQLFSSAELLLESGFSSHYVCDENQTVLDLASKTADRVLSEFTSRYQLSATDIHALLYATCLTKNGNVGDEAVFSTTGDVKHYMQFPASHIQNHFNLNNAFVMGINQTACTSLLGSIRIAGSLLNNESDLNNILCLTADRFPATARYEQTYNLISDGSAGCIVRKGAGAFKLLASHHITNGSMTTATDDEAVGFFFNYMHRLLTECVTKSGYTISDINYIVPQNTNVKAWQVLSSLLKFNFSQVLMPTREDIGHCISGDNLINLLHLHNHGIFNKGDLLLLPMAGFGLNWACILLEKT